MKCHTKHSEVKDGWVRYSKYFWDDMGKQIGWCPFTLALYYFEYLEEKLTTTK